MDKSPNFLTHDVCQMLGVSHQTVKTWTTEFGRHLSPLASPEKGARRLFTVDDVKRLALVGQMRAVHRTTEDVHAALESGLLGELPDEATVAVARGEDRKVALLVARIADLEAETRTLAERALKAVGQVELLQSQLTEREAHIRSLYREIAALEARGK